MNAETEFVAPIIFFVENTTPLGKPIMLFNASKNRGKVNNGLPAGVSVRFDYPVSPLSPQYTYDQMIADAEEAPFIIWKFRYDLVNSPVTALQMAEEFSVVKVQSDADSVGYPLFPYEDLDQTISTAREFRYPVTIDSDTGLSFFLHQRTQLRFMVWMDKNAGITNKLMTGKAEHIFSKPFPLEEKNPYLVRISYKNSSIDFME